MRLFVAADISDETRDLVRGVQQRLQQSLQEARRPPRVVWVRPEQAHVTLRFIGHVADAVSASVLGALEAPLDMGSFEIDWQTIGTFPAGRAPRVVWIAPVAGAERLIDLAGAVHERLHPVVGPGDSRPFRPHLTVGRVKEPGALDWRDTIRALQPVSARTLVDHITLYESRLSPKGPTYTVVCRTPLKP